MLCQTRVQFVLTLVVGGWLTCALLQAQNVSEQYLLAAANQDRAAHQLPPLRADDSLALAARTHAYEMARQGTISHQFDGEADLAKRAGDSGSHFSLITENVAEAPNSSQIHDLWMNSAGHRANLLDPKVDAVGIAVVQKHGQLYAVEDFARTVAQLSIAQQEATVSKLLATAGLVQGGNIADARQTCTMSSGYIGPQQPGFVMRFSSSSLDRLPPELMARLATQQYRAAVVGACVTGHQTPFTVYNVAVMLFR